MFKPVDKNEKSSTAHNQTVTINLGTKEDGASWKSTVAHDTDTPTELEDSILPKWLTRYLQFRFDVLDRTGKFYMYECMLVFE